MQKAERETELIITLSNYHIIEFIFRDGVL
jgi:hypothetical protein